MLNFSKSDALISSIAFSRSWLRDVRSCLAAQFARRQPQPDDNSQHFNYYSGRQVLALLVRASQLPDIPNLSNLAMRLINVKTLEVEEFFDDRIPTYAVLSHMWDTDKVTFSDI